MALVVNTTKSQAKKNATKSVEDRAFLFYESTFYNLLRTRYDQCVSVECHSSMHVGSTL